MHVAELRCAEGVQGKPHSVLRRFDNPFGNPPINMPTHVNQCEMSHSATTLFADTFAAYIFDIRHPCYIHLTPVKTKYQLCVF